MTHRQSLLPAALCSLIALWGQDAAGAPAKRSAKRAQKVAASVTLSLGCAGPVRRVPEVVVGTTDPPQQPSAPPDLIQKTIARAKPAIRYCYEAELQKH